jgi:hypothetical protein
MEAGFIFHELLDFSTFFSTFVVRTLALTTNNYGTYAKKGYNLDGIVGAYRRLPQAMPFAPTFRYILRKSY